MSCRSSVSHWLDQYSQVDLDSMSCTGRDAIHGTFIIVSSIGGYVIFASNLERSVLRLYYDLKCTYHKA